MPINPTYPGVYIEEVPSTSRTITPAPTSIGAFIGYSDPFQTRSTNFGKAVLLFSFSDYERELGGFFSSGIVSSDLPNAVNEFFLNGGSIAYVVGLEPKDGATALQRATATVAGAQLAASRLVDRVPMQATVLPDPGDPTKAELTITYGTQAEVHRGTVADLTASLGQSSLVSISSGAIVIPPGPPTPPPAPVPFTQPAVTTGTFNPDDFKDVFAADSPLDKVEVFNLLVLPGVTDTSVLSAALAFAERKRAFLIMDPKEGLAADTSDPTLPDTIEDNFKGTTVPKSPNGAIYFPYLKAQDPVTGDAVDLPPSGYVAGVYARTDTNRGVWKAPAGIETTLLDTTGVVPSGRMTDMRQGTLNPLGVNCIRDFAGVGTVIFGARTLVAKNDAFQQWRYVPVRRMALFIEQTLYANLKWVVFEPNDEPLWTTIRVSVENFMLSLFNQGAFQGSKPSQAFLVKCDSTTTTQTDIDLGIVNILVGFRPLKPAEFVIVKIAQLAGQVQS